MPDPLRLAVALNGYGLEHADGRREVLSWPDVAGLARRAEELGYEAIFTPEIAGWEAFALLSGLAAETERVGLVTGVVRLGLRDPRTLAMAARSLQERSGGRFTLGVGSSDRIAATEEAVRRLRALLDAAEGETDWPGTARQVPLYLAALGPRMVELAGEAADGAILNWCTTERVAEARAAIPPRAGFTLAVYVRACLSPVDDRATEALRLAASRYAELPPYRRQLEAMGLDPADPAGVAERVCIRGDRDTAIERLRDYRDAGADLVVVYPIAAGEAVSSLEGTLMAAAPDPTLEQPSGAR